MKRLYRVRVCALLAILLTTACFLTDPNPSPEINVACDVQELIDYMDWANGDPRPITLILDDDCLYELTTENNLVGRNGDTTGESGANGLPPVQGDLTILGNDALIRRSYAAGTPEFRIFFVSSSGSLTVNNLLLENGRSPYGGGGIYVDGGTLLLEDSEAYNHETVGAGGAILNEEGDVTIRGSSVNDNGAVAGGAISNSLGTLQIEDFSVLMGNSASLDGGAILNRGTLTMESSRVLNNDSGRSGGGIFTLYTTASVDITDSFLEDNAATSQGGGIAAFEVNLTLHGTYFARNQSLRGGAINAQNNLVTIQNGTFVENTTVEMGGAIHALFADVTVDESTFTENTGSYGGAIAHRGTNTVLTVTASSFAANSTTADSGGAIFNNVILNVSGCTFETNQAAMSGGGIYNNNSGNATILNSTFSGNYADGGGGIFNGGSLGIISSTFANNDAIRAAAIWSYYTGSISIKNIIIANHAGTSPCDISGATIAGEFVDTSGTCPGYTTSDDPLLQPLADNGGPTHTHAFAPGSPVIDTALDCTDLQAQPVNTDQRGVSRPYPAGGACDPGAYEFDLAPPPPPPAEPTTSAGFLPSACAIQNTTCREGPDQRFEAAGYLLEGECADISGRSEDGLWFVIPNPDWEGDCFVAGYLVETSGPLDDLPVIIGPSLPAPTETPIMGCLVQPLRGGDPVCTAPCPEGAMPGDPCTP